MSFKRLNASSGCSHWWLLIALPFACVGCTQNWWNSFLDPSQTGNFRHNQLVEIQKSISFNDKPLGLPGSSDPTPEDIVAYVEEYRIGPGDVLTVVLLDFLQVGAETTLTPLTVDELGYINIPQLLKVHAEGRTAYELQDDLIQLAKQAEIYNQDSQPTVTVTVLGQQQRLYHITGPGGMVTSGAYQIIRPDFRLREAITSAGSLDPLIKNIYVMRNQPRNKKIRDHGLMPASTPGTGGENMPTPPVSPVFMAETGGGATPKDTKKSQSQPARRLAVPQDQAERELIEAVEPGSTAPAAPDSASAPQAVTPNPASNPTNNPSKPNWTFVNDRFIEMEPNSTTTTTQGTMEPSSSSPTTSQSQPVDWQELADEGQQRIIRIPADKLRNGDPSVDIVIRHQDWIRVDTGPVGVFYLNGHVGRPGTYTFQGEEITLRQAIASASGLDPLAWPSRCSITRRLDDDREEILQLDLARIMDGKDPDFYLKPNDLVDVGTHAIAPFLATIRNSFRLTYGFGFVYDRNFADLDAYFPQQNPTDRRRATLSARFPGLFP